MEHEFWENNSGAVVRAKLTSQRCDPGSNPSVNAISVCCWFSPLLREVFFPGTPVFPSPRKPFFFFTNSNSIWYAQTRLNKFLRTPECFVGEQIAIYIFSVFFSCLCEPGNRENWDAFYRGDYHATFLSHHLSLAI